MNMLLAEIEASQWVLLGVIVVLIICYPIFVIFRNKKEQEKATKLSDSIKVGKEVLTSSGVYGTVVDINQTETGKIVTLQTGSGNYKSYIAVDALAIYTVLNPDPEEPEISAKNTANAAKTNNAASAKTNAKDSVVAKNDEEAEVSDKNAEDGKTAESEAKSDDTKSDEEKPANTAKKQTKSNKQTANKSKKSTKKNK